MEFGFNQLYSRLCIQVSIIIINIYKLIATRVNIDLFKLFILNINYGNI